MLPSYSVLVSLHKLSDLQYETLQCHFVVVLKKPHREEVFVLFSYRSSWPGNQLTTYLKFQLTHLLTGHNYFGTLQAS